MLLLESPRWNELRHAYGAASDTPGLLARLSGLPPSQGEDEPWFTLWSSLAHQGDVYTASFAAVPHVIEALSRAPLKADAAYFQFPAWIEVCRKRQNVEVPSDLAAYYFASLSRLPGLIAAASGREWDSSFLQCAMAALAAAKGSTLLAEASLELSDDVAAEFLEWLDER
jgi:hypothetical protein